MKRQRSEGNIWTCVGRRTLREVVSGKGSARAHPRSLRLPKLDGETRQQLAALRNSHSIKLSPLQTPAASGTRPRQNQEIRANLP